jgi:predicted metalloprotease
MEWKPGGTSNDIEDRRDDSGGGGGGFGFGHLGIGGIIIVGLLSLIFQKNLFVFFSGSGATQTTHRAPNRALDEQEKPQVQFISFVLDDVQKNWDAKLPEQEDRRYRHAKLVLFRDRTHSACGLARDEVGPFYCPVDEKVYLDLGFFDELRNRFRAPGQFAQAYVVAHEIGHHVQKILGIEPKVHALQQRRPEQANALSVRLELQADCFAGVWANSTEQRNLIDTSDVESALGAAAAVGDDRLQRMATGSVSPEKFTHGSSAQRTSWFKRGLSSGRLSACNTFQTRR